MNEEMFAKQKKEILSGLKDEVREFHPLLEKIFARLPDVVSVENTHGQNEMGADFIIGQTHKITDGVDYIGVIVKVGKIAQDHSDIERQIDECEEERLILGGKQKILLQEIWVVSNENITSGAQIKIHRKYATKKIRFMDGSIVCKWTDEYFPNFWYTVPLLIGDYLQKISVRINEENRAHSLLPHHANNFYVPQELRKVELTYGLKKNKSRGEKKETVSVFHSIEKNQITLIEGGAGSGKSQMLRNATAHYASPVIYLEKKWIPIFVGYRDICGEYKADISLLLKKTIDKIGLDGEVKDHQFILFIDGIDEHPEGYDKAVGCLKSLLTDITLLPNCKIVLTTRPLDSKALASALPVDAPRLEIVPLNFKKVTEFVENICSKDKISSRLYDDLRNSVLFRQLPMTPIAAILLAHLMDDDAKDLPSNLTELYMRYTELMLGRWDIRKGMESQKEFEAAKNIVMKLADYSVSHSLSYMSDKEAKKMFEEYLDARNLDIDADALFNRVTSRSGILQRDESRGVVAFKHLSFAEFFYAMHKNAHPEKDFINERIYDPDWSNVYFFYIGLKKDCEDILEEMLSYPLSEVDDSFFRMALFADYLMAAYATPYKTIEKALTMLLIETGKFYDDLNTGKIKSKFSCMSPIRLLEFLKVIINNRYGYEYFRKAMDTAVLDIIGNEALSDNQKGYSLFFLSTMFVTMKEANPFEGLIDHLKDRLPVAVQFGVMYESERVNLHSAAVKKQTRKLIQSAQRSKPFGNYVTHLHADSIDKILSLEVKKASKKLESVG